MCVGGGTCARYLFNIPARHCPGPGHRATSSSFLPSPPINRHFRHPISDWGQASFPPLRKCFLSRLSYHKGLTPRSKVTHSLLSLPVLCLVHGIIRLAAKVASVLRFSFLCVIHHCFKLEVGRCTLNIEHAAPS